MGYLLGASPAHPDAHADSVTAAPPPVESIWVETRSLDVERQPRGIAAFAIDSPRAGERSPGAGLEIAGWVIGREARAVGIRAAGSAGLDRVFVIDVPRPDVGADYPAFAEGARSGFLFWAPLPGEGAWQIALNAILADGAEARLATITGRASAITQVPGPGKRAMAAPDFVIIGAQRGGTTSLYAYLSEHPRIAPAAAKELHFLTDRHERGRDWYLGQFPAELPPGVITGEATPYALFHPLSPARLRAVAPEARLIAVLRNPIERAYSHYVLERARGDEALDFVAAIEAEAERLAGEEARLVSEAGYVSEAHKHASYLARGDYAPQLERWLARFPRERLLVIRSEDLYERTAETFARVTSFLGIPPGAPRSFEVHNRLSGPPLDPAVRARLSRHFAPRNARLAALLGWDPGWD
jgi:hypothetical protein